MPVVLNLGSTTLFDQSRRTSVVLIIENPPALLSGFRGASLTRLRWSLLRKL